MGAGPGLQMNRVFPLNRFNSVFGPVQDNFDRFFTIFSRFFNSRHFLHFSRILGTFSKNIQNLQNKYLVRVSKRNTHRIIPKIRRNLFGFFQTLYVQNLGNICVHSNKLNHPCTQSLTCIYINYTSKPSSLLNDIRAIIFHRVEHQDFESIPVLMCKCIIIPRLRFTRIGLNPIWLTQLHYYHTNFGSKLSQ